MLIIRLIVIIKHKIEDGLERINVELKAAVIDKSAAKNLSSPDKRDDKSNTNDIEG